MPRWSQPSPSDTVAPRVPRGKDDALFLSAIPDTKPRRVHCGGYRAAASRPPASRAGYRPSQKHKNSRGLRETARNERTRGRAGTGIALRTEQG